LSDAPVPRPTPGGAPPDPEPDRPALAHEVELPCASPDEALAFLVDRLGFSARRLLPADDPALGEVEGYGLLLRLVRPGGPPDTAIRPLEGRAVVCRGATEWRSGRAGMRYRDLLPERLGGRMVASHISVDSAGPVPDRVHFHVVAFQLIHCLSGWVRVVYEDQGEPILLREGDGVLQPPGIRHRVLEASEGLEVFELVAPAVHETVFDGQLQLPTGRSDPGRRFGDQTFVHYTRGAPETGVAVATGGLADVRCHGAIEDLEGPAALQVVLVVQGEVAFDGERLGRGDLVARPAGAAGRFHDPGHDLALLEVRFTADPSS
jgi:quercetin dioxygenase-like cupin family protein